MILSHGANSIVSKGDWVYIGGRLYPYVQIGNQLWLAENLDYKFSGCSIGGSDTPSTPNAWYFNNDETTYGWEGKKYGLLYNWYAAKYIEDNKSTLLPEGWHVPYDTDWNKLANEIGGTSIAGTLLKSTTDWTNGAGTDAFGFTAFPTGSCNGSSFYNLGLMAIFWEPTAYNIDYGEYRYLDAGNSLGFNNFYKTRGYSIRLVKDIT